MCSLKKVLVVRASGGLSNRLQAIVCAIAYCLLTNRAICVDWRDGLYSDNFSNVFPLWFNINELECMSIEDIIQHQAQASMTPVFWRDWLHEPIAIEYIFSGNDHTLPQNRTNTTINIEDDKISEDIAIFWDWRISSIAPLIPKLKEKFPHMAKMDDATIPSYLIQKYISPTLEVEREAEHFYHKYFQSPPVGIHIRHTDLQSPLPMLLEKLKEVAKDENIFLCTDNEQVEKMVCKLFPKTVTINKTYQGTNIPLHCFVEGISNVQKGREAVIDMLVLARCKHIIHFTRSSFARIPILLSGLDSEHIHSV